jgi:hypothetical protein
MSSPITFETPVGYIVAEDVYVSYSEYYGDGTIYGRNDLLMPDGSPVKGAGKTKAELINANVTLSEVGVGTVTGDIVVVSNDSAPAPAPEEGSVPAPEEKAVPEPAPEEGSAPAPEEKAVPEPAPAPEVIDESTNNLYTVSFSVLGFEITREFTVKIDKETRKIYLS